MDINDLVRENIKNLRPYSTARDEFKGQASIFLDANENSYGFAFTCKLQPLSRSFTAGFKGCDKQNKRSAD